MTDREMDEKRTSVSRVQSIREFGSALSEARQRAGLSVRQIAQRVDVPRTTVGDYFAGRSVPTAATSGVLRKVLHECGIRDDDELEAWESALIRVRRAPGPAPADAPQPYRSLAPFQPADAEWFYGRDDLVTDLVVLAQQCRELPLFVLGQSGAGKSSLLRAGVIPAFEERGWQVVLGTPLSLVLPRASEQLLVVVDQFEELFTAPDPTPTFVDDLFALAAAAGVAVLCGMRADFYDRAIGHPKLATALRQETAVVGAMSSDELRSAIVLPARKAGVDIEDGLVELLLRDFTPTEKAGDGALPLLSHALHATWSAGNRRRMTIDGYLSTGGVAHAVGQSADTIYLELPPDGKRLARSLLLRLVHVGDGVADTRRRVPRTDFPPEYSDVLDRFITGRLITIDTDTVSISHEALVHAWPRLRAWLDDDRDALRTHQRLQNAALAWVASGRDSSGLYRGTLLATAEGLLKSVELTVPERQFVDAGLTARRHEEQERQRQLVRLRRWVSGLVAAVMLAAALVAVVVKQRADAISDRNVAVSRQTALRADTLRTSDPALAAQLSLAAFRIAPTPEARSSVMESGHTPFASRARGSDGTIAVAVSQDNLLLATGGADGTTRLWRIGDNRRLTAEGEPFAGGPGSVFGAAVSPSRRVLALTGINHGLVLWDIRDPRRPVRLPDREAGLTGTGYAAAFSPDGRYLAVAGQGGLRLWHTDSDGVPATLVLSAEIDGDGKAVAFSGDSRQLAAGSLAGTVHLWQLHGLTSTGHSTRTVPAAVNGMSFDPGGTTLAVAGKDRAIHLLGLDGRADTSLDGMDGPVYSVGYSNDGTRLVAGISNSDALVWRLPVGSAPQVLPHPGPVTATTFLSGTTNLVTASADGHARLWTLPGGRLAGHPGPISTVAFGPDDHTLAVSASSASKGPGTVSWSATSPSPRQIATAVADPLLSGASALSHDGKLLATGNTDGTTRLWRVDASSQPAAALATLTGPDKLIQSIAINTTSTLLATGGDDHVVRLWDISSPATPHLLATMREATNVVMSVAFSLDGRSLAATSIDSHAYLWDITIPSSPASAHRLSMHLNYVYSVAFSPDSTTLALAGADKTVTLWDITDPTRPQSIGKPLVGPGNYVYSVAFAPVGALLAAVSTDGSVWLWNVTDRARPAVHATVRTEKSLYSLAFNRKGLVLAGGDAEGTAHLWPLDPEAVATSICADDGEHITRSEWEQFIPDLAFRAPCE